MVHTPKTPPRAREPLDNPGEWPRGESHQLLSGCEGILARTGTRERESNVRGPSMPLILRDFCGLLGCGCMLTQCLQAKRMLSQRPLLAPPPG